MVSASRWGPPYHDNAYQNKRDRTLNRRSIKRPNNSTTCRVPTVPALMTVISLRAAGDEPLHQDHQEAEVLAVLPHRLVVAQANVLRHRLVQMLLELVLFFPPNGHELCHPGHEKRVASVVDRTPLLCADHNAQRNADADSRSVGLTEARRHGDGCGRTGDQGVMLRISGEFGSPFLLERLLTQSCCLKAGKTKRTMPT